jgi:hypothetical protein
MMALMLMAREIVDAIKTMKNGKAAGSDNIPAEVLKADPYAIADILLPLFQDIWQKEKFPKEWKEGIIIKVPKKGDLSHCRNWRGVTLLVVISKIFKNLILERIKDMLDRGLRKEQAGFRRNRSCIDQINTLRVIIEQSLEFQSPLYTCKMYGISFWLHKRFAGLVVHDLNHLDVTTLAVTVHTQHPGTPPQIYSIKNGVYVI